MNTRFVPLADRMRPISLDEMRGQEHLLGPNSFLRQTLEQGHIFSVIFWGAPGSGKTTLARLFAQYTKNHFQGFSAVTSGLKDLREIIQQAREEYQQSGRPTILFVDEIHRFNKAQQDAFLPHIENGLIILVGATTQNPSFEIIPPLLSRARVIMLQPLGEDDLKEIMTRALHDKERGLGNLDLDIEPAALEHLADLSSGDARTALNNLEITAQYLLGRHEEGKVINLETVEKALDRKALPYDKDGEEHYNLISAFHKSMRGSDPQASLYWLYRMLMAGEDPLFICRRMIRFASEDIGLADPHALSLALAAFETWEKLGPPEAELALAEAAVYLAAAPKSNALYIAEKAVKKEIERSGNRPVPLHIRNAPTRLMKRLGYSRGYLYPHNYPGAWVEQEYLPRKLNNMVYYQPTGRGLEKEIREKMNKIQMRKEKKEPTGRPKKTPP